MLIYLDTAQFAELQRVNAGIRANFLDEWRDLGCELALSLQLLQEVAKSQGPENVKARLETILSLKPLRGLPAGSVGVMVSEATLQMMSLTGQACEDPAGYGEATLFPMMDEHQPSSVIRGYFAQLNQFNEMGALVAELESTTKILPKVKKRKRVAPEEFEEQVRRVQRGDLGSMPQQAGSFLRTISEAAIRDAHAADGDLWIARIRRFGLADLKCLDELQPEDYSKAAGFLGVARSAADDIAVELGLTPEEVLELVDHLRPYEAPGYSIEMAVSRAREGHNAPSTASDQVDEEHVCFAPYVDLLFVDKRTKDFVGRELRRDDGRIVEQATSAVSRARHLEDVLAHIRRRADSNKE